MTEKEIQNVINSLTQVNPERNYWFVRTLGGNYYDEFLDSGFIAIGYDEINLIDIKRAHSDNEIKEEILAETIKKVYPDETRPRYIGTQLIDFVYNIKKGDIVVIPSASTERVSIGEISETPVYIGSIIGNNPNACPFTKRKKVKWIKKSLLFDSLDPKLYHLKYSQRTVTQISAQIVRFLDREIAPIFIKDQGAHLSLDIRQHNSIKAVDLFSTWLTIFNLVESFGKEESLDINKNDFDIRINVQSPGVIEFISYGICGIVTLSIIIAAIVGAEVETNSNKFKYKIKTEGLFKRLTEYLNAKTDRKFKEELIKKMQTMDIRPDEIVSLLEKINNNSSGKN